MLHALSLVLLIVAANEFEVVRAVQQYNHFMVMMFENQGYNEVTANAYWKQVIQGGLLVTNYYGLTHPSQCNYVGQIGGSLFQCTGDNDYSVNATSIPDLLEAKGLTWKSYQENYTPLQDGGCDMSTTQNNIYYRKHNPFMSYWPITSNHTRCLNIVNSQQFETDLNNNMLPNFIYYTPDINDDAHNTNLDFSGQFLQGFLQKYKAKLSTNTLVFITFDEDGSNSGGPQENNHVMGLFLGLGITNNTIDDGTKYNHYSVANTVETIWNLGNLGRGDVGAGSLLNAISVAKLNPNTTTTPTPTPTASGNKPGSASSIQLQCHYMFLAIFIAIAALVTRQ